ncbi:MAG: hypothetical protein ACSLFJ_07910, partial [Immundisolibacter sp.]|uniref:hypothetical protein n=1 Tax=Immundisolibacter sp. TaxID=1934948 RepID=UPI003EE10490
NAETSNARTAGGSPDVRALCSRGAAALRFLGIGFATRRSTGGLSRHALASTRHYRIAFAMAQHEQPPHPLYVLHLRADAVMLDTDPAAQVVKLFWPRAVQFCVPVPPVPS